MSVEEYKLGNKEKAISEVRKSFSIYPSQEVMYIYSNIENNKPIKVNFTF